MKSLNHGKLSTYTVHKCRCDKCKEAQKLYMRDYKIRYPEQVKLNAVRTKNWYYRTKSPNPAKRVAADIQLLTKILTKR